MTAADKESRAGSGDALRQILPCPFCGSEIRHITSLAKSFDPPRLYHEWHHVERDNDCLISRYCSKIVCEATDDVEQQRRAVARLNRRAALPLTDPLSSGHGVGSVVLALENFISIMSTVERPAFVDPDYGNEVALLGNRVGFGALMTSASASWRARLIEEGCPAGGEFVAGPCYATVLSAIKQGRDALQTSSPALQGSEEVLGNATLAVPISETHRISSEGRRDE